MHFLEGVGKTTCAILACKELKLRYMEKNASDVRNKKALEAQTSEVIGCEQMDSYLSGSVSHKSKFLKQKKKELVDRK